MRRGCSRIFQHLDGLYIVCTDIIQIGLYAVDRGMLAELVARLDRRMAFQLSVMEGHLYFTIDGGAIDGAVVKHSLVPAA